MSTAGRGTAHSSVEPPIKDSSSYTASCDIAVSRWYRSNSTLKAFWIVGLCLKSSSLRRFDDFHGAAHLPGRLLHQIGMFILASHAGVTAIPVAAMGPIAATFLMESCRQFHLHSFDVLLTCPSCILHARSVLSVVEIAVLFFCFPLSAAVCGTDLQIHADRDV
jgi:hypothetical protein